MNNIEMKPSVEDKELKDELKRRAGMEAEFTKYGNPTQWYEPGTLKNDLSDIEEVKALAEALLRDPVWLKKTTEEIKNGKQPSNVAKAHDPEYKPGRGILQAHDKEQYKKAA